MNKDCFLIMGFGKKQRPLSYDQIDFDNFYIILIVTAISQADFTPIRADEINTNEMVGKKFLQKILFCNVVVADISALNANAMYELGIRHALRPFTTIIIKDDLTDFPFDINQNSIITYSHCLKKSQLDKSKQALTQRLKNINDQMDSPVYTFLDYIKPIDFCKMENRSDMEDDDNIPLHDLLEQADKNIDDDNFKIAKELLFAACEYHADLYPIKTKIAFCMYKENVSSLDNLRSAYDFMHKEGLLSVNNSETLSIAGAINKRLWKLSSVKAYLDKSVELYQRAYFCSNSFYPGSNLGYLLLELSYIENDIEVKRELFYAAKYLFRSIIADCEKNIDDEWAVATLGACYEVIGQRNLAVQCANQELNAVWKNASSSSQFLRIQKLMTEIRDQLGL